MKLDSCQTTFLVDEVWEITLSLFVDSLNKSREKIKAPYSKPALFSFYEELISYPIDDFEDGEDQDRQDFYEIVSIMSWALYREWVKKVVDERSDLDCFDGISKKSVIKLFFDNLNCEEGRLLLEKMK